jgi:hypothetical protein
MPTSDSNPEIVADIPADLPLPEDERTSILLKRVLRELHGDKVSIGHVMHELRRRSFGGALIMLAALSLLPGISFLAGIVMILPALQMVVGYRAPLLPRFIRNRQVEVARLRVLGNKAVVWIEKIERFVKPRWSVLTIPSVITVVGLIVIGLALVITIPLPFSNFPPAIAVLCLAFGILERDGLLIFIGLVVSSIALTIGFLIGYVAIESISRIL